MIKRYRPGAPEEKTHLPAPDVKDHPVWDAPATKSIDIEEAIVKVLALGARMRLCRFCDSPATEITLMEYECRGDGAHVNLLERCVDCGGESKWQTSGQVWACIEAMRAWEGLRTAQAVFNSERQDARDLDQLDGA